MLLKSAANPMSCAVSGEQRQPDGWVDGWMVDGWVDGW